MAASPLGLGPPGVMSPGGSGGDFASLVRQLMAADDRTRKGAEAIYDRMIRTNAVVVSIRSSTSSSFTLVRNPDVAVAGRSLRVFWKRSERAQKWMCVK